MRFAGRPTNRGRYDFSPSIRYPTVPGTSAASQSAGAILPALYNQNARTGWQPGQTLKNSIGLRAREKSAAIQADARIRMSEITRDSLIKATQKQTSGYTSAIKDAGGKKLLGAGIGAAVQFGLGALLSDETTKNTIEPLENALATLRSLKPVTFYYNEEYSSSPERMHYGFIAQDYAKVMPDATYYDMSKEKMCIDTNELIALLVRAIQQLETRITRVEASQVLTGV